MNDELAAGLVGASLLRIVNLGAKNTATQEPIDRTDAHLQPFIS